MYPSSITSFSKHGGGQSCGCASWHIPGAPGPLSLATRPGLVEGQDRLVLHLKFIFGVFFFFLFLFAKTIILNKCRLFVFLFSSCGRKRLGVEWAAPYFYPAVAQTPTQNLLLPWADREPVPREGHQATDGENQCP